VGENREGLRVAKKKNTGVKKDDVHAKTSAPSQDKKPVDETSQEPVLDAPESLATDADEAIAIIEPAAAEPDTQADASDDTASGDEEAVDQAPNHDDGAQTEAVDDTVSDTPEASSDIQEPETSIQPTPEPQIAEQRSGMMPLIIGGVVAAFLGFLAARADLLDNFLPPSMRADAPETDTRAQLESLQDALAQANAKIEALEARPEPELAPQEAAEFDTTALDASIAELADRISTIEARPVGEAAPAPAAPNYDAAFKALQDTAAAQQAELDRLLQDARLVEESSEAAANAALARAAATRIVAAVETGAPFDAALADLAQTGVEIPETLTAAAATGVAQLSKLQEDVSDAARSALAAARSADTEGGLGSFLQRQLGARSVTPREGSDPDAVLSRVEAAVREGRLNDALAEADTLPPEGQAAMADWLDATRARLDVTTATEALMQRLAAN
jgi:hypothetical protein